MSDRLWVPLSVRQEVARAIQEVRPCPDRLFSELQMEAAIDALTPWIRSLVDDAEDSGSKPVADGDGLEDNRA
jgi:hypothetical protein